MGYTRIWLLLNTLEDRINQAYGDHPRRGGVNLMLENLRREIERLNALDAGENMLTDMQRRDLIAATAQAIQDGRMHFVGFDREDGPLWRGCGDDQC